MFIKPPKMSMTGVFLSNTCFVCVKETVQVYVTFKNPKHMFY